MKEAGEEEEKRGQKEEERREEGKEGRAGRDWRGREWSSKVKEINLKLAISCINFEFHIKI